jgi:hypothetical protein
LVFVSENANIRLAATKSAKHRQIRKSQSCFIFMLQIWIKTVQVKSVLP